MRGSLREPLWTSGRAAWNGELVTECTSQRSPGTLSETLSEPLSECHFPLGVAGLVAPNSVAPLKLTLAKYISRISFVQISLGTDESFGFRSVLGLLCPELEMLHRYRMRW